MKRVQTERVLQVGRDQFLVLLFVMRSQKDEAGYLDRELFVDFAEESGHPGVNMGAVGVDFGDGWAAQQAPARAEYAVADGVVVGVEEKAEPVVEDPIAGGVRSEDESLEEPGGMGEVPFHGAGIGHGLQEIVLGSEGGCQVFGSFADRLVSVEEPGTVDRRNTWAGGRGVEIGRHVGGSEQ